MNELSIIINGVRYDAVGISEEDVEFCDLCFRIRRFQHLQKIR